MKRYFLEEREYTKEDIFDQRLFNVFVVSLPRCGSSMMVGIVERLGVNMLYTTEEEKAKEAREKRYEKKFGTEYVPNPFFGEVMPDDLFNTWIEAIKIPYSGFKMILPLRHVQTGILRHTPHKIIMMWRDPEEIRQSQNAFYSDDADLAYIERVLVEQPLKFDEYDFDYKVVKYQDVVDNPEKIVGEVADYINAPNNITEAVSWVNPDAKRFTKSELVIGI